MRLLGTMLSTSVHAHRHGPTCPPGLAMMRTSACAGGKVRRHSMAAVKNAFDFTIPGSLRRGTHRCPAPLMVSGRSSGRSVLDGADDRRQHGAGNATPAAWP